MTRFIDTSYVAALINTRDQLHPTAKVLADRYRGERFLTTDSVLLEIGNTLACGFKRQAVEVIEYLLTATNVKVVRLTSALFQDGFDLYTTFRDKDWGLVDCISFVAMRDHGVTDALTHDRHFVQAGFRALMRDEA